MTGLAWTNRRIIARRTGWPAGALAECERLDTARPGWSFWWLAELRIPGWERPAGLSAVHSSGVLVGGDELRRGRPDNVRRSVRVFGPDTAQLLARITAAEKRLAVIRAADQDLIDSIRRGLT